MSDEEPVRRGAAIWMAAGVLAVVAAIAAYHIWLKPARTPTPPADRTPLPPLTDSPFLNTKPGVEYVGDRACADCHQEQTKTYRQHPMGRSLFSAGDAPPIERYDSAARNPLVAGRFHFEVVRRGTELIHMEWCQDPAGNVVAQQEAKIAYVVGSGAQARSYLTGDDGFLFESPVTWYTPKAQWDLSPGYEKLQYHFTRRVDSRCLYCHSDGPRPVEHSINRYRDPPFGQLAIGCERCHGPGALHVRTQAVKDGIDTTIVNPRRLSPTLRDNVCEQCHLQGEAIVARRGRAQSDYRPGLALHEFMSVFVRPPETTDASKIVTHFEQMHLSVCAQQSGGRFTCTSCHDPHAQPAPDRKVAFYRGRCLTCHGQPPAPAGVAARGCRVPAAERTAKAPGDNCVACHMPRALSSNASHLSVTDHRVLRRPDRPSPDPRSAPAGDEPLVPFHRHLLAPDDEARTRDLGIALAELAMATEGPQTAPARDFLTRRALPMLDRSAARAPDDVPALEALGYALHVRGQPAEALRVMADALARAPDRESALTWAARIAEKADQLELAERYARRLVEKYPHYSDHHHRLAVILMKRHNGPGAVDAARAAVAANPFSAEARAVLIGAYLETGDRSAARAEFDRLGVIHPDHRDRIRAWFEERVGEKK